MRGVSNCDKLLNLDNFPLTMPVREIYAPELPESGEASDRRVLFPRPSWDSGVVVAAVCRQLLVLPAPSGVDKARLHFPGPVCIRRGLSQVTSYSVLLRTYAKYWYAKTGTLKPSHHVPKNLLAQRKPRFSGTWWKLNRIRKEIKGEKRELLWTRLRGVSNCDKLRT